MKIKLELLADTSEELETGLTQVLAGMRVSEIPTSALITELRGRLRDEGYEVQITSLESSNDPD